ncbi:MAG: hypothetical protein V2A58_14725, partial [Planctomycetota bacterium]
CDAGIRSEGRALSGRDSSRVSFTIAEILVVIVIITLLMAFLVPAAAGLRAHARKNATRQRIDYLKVAIEAFKADYGVYPPDRIDAVLRLLECGPAATIPIGYYSDRAGEDNEGVKALWIALTCPKKNGPYIDDDPAWHRVLPGGHVYYAKFSNTPVICNGLNTTIDSTLSGNDTWYDGTTGAAPDPVTPGQILILPGPDGVLDSTASPDDVDLSNLREDPRPIRVFVDSWGNDLHYDRTNSATDNAVAGSPNPAMDGGAIIPSGDSHMLRNASSYDLWSSGPNAINDCLDAPGATDRSTWDANDADDISNWAY